LLLDTAARWHERRAPPRVYHRDSAASLLIYEEGTISVVAPAMGSSTPSRSIQTSARTWSGASADLPRRVVRPILYAMRQAGWAPEVKGIKLMSNGGRFEDVWPDK